MKVQFGASGSKIYFMDDEIVDLIAKEEKRQRQTLMLIPSENYAFPEVQRAVGSVLMHKYAEGYPGRRYYQGCEFVDEIESLAIERAKKLFGVPFANVQALSGSLANMAVYFALLKPGDKIMGMDLSSGGHLTHGQRNNFSGKIFRSVLYTVGKDGWLDYNQVEKIARKERPKIIVCGFTAYPRLVDFEKFGQIADKIGAWLLADISHVAGLVVGGVHPSPVLSAHIMTTTTHKTLRGPKGAIIMVTQKGLNKDKSLGEKINKAVFPELQGGPFMNNIAGIAICLKKVKEPKFQKYAKQTLINAQALAETLLRHGVCLSTGGTDTHMILIDLRNLNINGKEAAERLEKNGIIVNKNFIPGDLGTAVRPSGIRLGTQAITFRGMKEREMEEIGRMIKDVLHEKKNVKMEVEKLCDRFPLM